MSKGKVAINGHVVSIRDLSAEEVIELLMETTQRIVDEYADKDENRIGMAITVAAGSGAQAASCVSGMALATDKDPDVLMLLGGMKASVDAMSEHARKRMEYGAYPKEGMN